jgi:hypothetical protein
VDRRRLLQHAEDPRSDAHGAGDNRVVKWRGMDSANPSMLRRVLAVLVLVLIGAAALRLAVGLVVGLVSAVVWILGIVALVVAVLWARSTLNSAKRQRSVKRSSARELSAAPAEDPVAVDRRHLDYVPGVVV